MAFQTLTAGAPNLPLTNGMKLKLEAVDPSTGAAVTGVVVTNWAIYGYDVSLAVDTDLFSVNPLLVPTSEFV